MSTRSWYVKAIRPTTLRCRIASESSRVSARMNAGIEGLGRKRVASGCTRDAGTCNDNPHTTERALSVVQTSAWMSAERKPQQRAHWEQQLHPDRD